MNEVKVLVDAAATAIYGRIGANGAIEITTRPFLSVVPLSPDESKARRLKFLQNIYANYFSGHTTSTSSAFRHDGFIYNGEDHAFNPDLFDTPAKEQFFGQLTYQHGHKTSEFLGPLGSDSRGIYVPLIREVEIMLPTNVDQNHVDSVVNAIRQAAKQADKSIESTDDLVRLAFIFGGKVKEGKPHPFRTFPMRENGSSDIESRYYFTPDAKAESSWWAEAYFRTTHPKKLVMHLVSVDKLYASDCPAILENRRHLEGTVVDDESGKPVADALVYIEATMGISDAGGVKTDEKGHFDLWLPFQEQSFRVSKSGYKDAFWIQPADTALTVRLIPASSPKQQPIPFKTVTSTGNGVKAGDNISGIMGDEAGPLFGGTVCEIDAKGRIVESAITDMNGAFKMKVRNPEDRIRFSYVGMKTITVPIDRKEYNVKMKPVESQYDYKMLRRVTGSGRNLPIPVREVKNVTILNEDLKGFTVTTDKGVSNENNPRITIPMSDKEQALVMSVNDLGFNIFCKLGAKNNILLSPMGMTYGLGLISNEAGGETKKQINMVLGCDDTKAANINEFCRKMLTEVQKLDRLTQMEISNDFFSQEEYTPKSAFAKIANDDYHAALKTLEPDIDKGFILMNTINFKGIWKDKFNGLIEDVVFKDEDGKETKVPMMNQKHQFFYTENDLCQAICLPYGNGAYQLIVLLPKGGKKVSEVAQWLTADNWEKMYDQLRRVDVDVKLPSFESSSDVVLTDVMRALGMPNAFDKKKADFSNLFNWESYIAQVRQKGHIKVDETGTEATVTEALQGRIMGLDLVQPDMVHFHATHPFLYFIREWSTSAIFFIGQYMGI